MPSNLGLGNVEHEPRKLHEPTHHEPWQQVLDPLPSIVRVHPQTIEVSRGNSQTCASSAQLMRTT